MRKLTCLLNPIVCSSIGWCRSFLDSSPGFAGDFLFSPFLSFFCFFGGFLGANPSSLLWDSLIMCPRCLFSK